MNDYQLFILKNSSKNYIFFLNGNIFTRICQYFKTVDL